MSHTNVVRWRDLLRPALPIAVLVAGAYWALDLLLSHLMPGARVVFSSLLALDAVTAKRIVASALIAISGIVAAMIACRSVYRTATTGTGDQSACINWQHEAVPESTFDSVLLVSEDGRVRKANATAGEMFGGPPSLFEGLAASTFFSVPGHPGPDLPDSSTIATFDPACWASTTQVTVLGLDGRNFPAQIRSSATTIDGARHFVLCIREVTGELAAKDALRQSESRYRSLFNNMLDGLYQSTAEGEILAANPALVRLLGYSSEEDLTRSVRTPQLYRYPEKRQQMTDLLARNQAVRNHEIELIRKDGTFVTVRANIRAVRGNADHGTVFEGTLSDISDVIAARAALLHSEELFRAMTEYALDVVAVLNESGDAIYVSPSSSNVSGMNPDRIVGRNVYPAIHRDDIASVKSVLAKAFADPGSPHEFTFRIFRNDGQLLFLEAVGSAYRTHDGELRAVIHSRDVSERMRTEAQLQQAQKMQAVGQLTGGIAHDFNNLLTVVVGNLELLEERVTGHEELGQLRTALRASMQGAELTRRLLAFSRRQFLEPKVMNVNDLLLGMEPIIRRSLHESIAIHTEYSGDIWLTKIDPAQLESALLNLAINSADSMEYDGQLSLSTKNCVLGTKDLPADTAGTVGEYVCVTVADTGCGMPEAVAQRAIEPFFSTKTSQDGTGLGLSMAYGFVRQSGGHMQIESKPDAGTSVHIYLPRSVEVPDLLAQTFSDIEMPGGSETIMVVEDNREARDSAAALLRSLGYKVIVADHGRSALHRLQTEKVQLLFSDVMMPQLSGFELANVARQFQPNIRVLLTTGFANLSNSSDSEALGHFEILPKPYTKRELAVRLRNQLDY